MLDPRIERMLDILLLIITCSFFIYITPIVVEACYMSIVASMLGNNTRITKIKNWKLRQDTYEEWEGNLRESFL